MIDDRACARNCKSEESFTPKLKKEKWTFATVLKDYTYHVTYEINIPYHTNTHHIMRRR